MPGREFPQATLARSNLGVELRQMGVLDLEPDSATVRGLLLTACKQVRECWLPAAISLDMDEWRLWIEIMADRILGPGLGGR